MGFHSLLEHSSTGTENYEDDELVYGSIAWLARLDAWVGTSIVAYEVGNTGKSAEAIR